LSPSKAPPPRKRGRPPLDEKRELIAMRLLGAELAAFRVAADKAGKPYTVWMRDVCRKACRLDR